MSKSADAFNEALLDLLAEDADLALTVLTGQFVSVAIEMVRRRGIDPEQEIIITGGRRRLTIHPANNTEVAHG